MSIWQQETQYVIDRHEEDARAAGLGEAWDHLIAQEDSGTRSMLLGVIGALSTYLVETGYAPS